MNIKILYSIKVTVMTSLEDIKQIFKVHLKNNILIIFLFHSAELGGGGFTYDQVE